MDLEAIFAVADSLGWGDAANGESPHHRTCCGDIQFVWCYKDGHEVCALCGTCQSAPIFDRMEASTYFRISNYKRLHHFHERISQFLIQESTVPQCEFECIRDGLRQYKVLNKANIRSVLRSLKLQKYIEKWLQIIWRITKHKPPSLPTNVTHKLDILFQALQAPFTRYKPSARKNFLNYNYTFHRFFQLLHLDQFCMFFPLIKSKHKLEQLDGIWKGICNDLRWQFKPLRKVPEFAIMNPLHTQTQQEEQAVDPALHSQPSLHP